MTNDEYIKCIIKMLKNIEDNKILKKIFEYVQRLFL